MVQQLLLVAQAIVVLLVYVFVWRVMRSARADLVAGGRPSRARGAAPRDVSSQESTIIPATDVHAARRAAGLTEPRLVVVQGDALRPGIPFTIGGGLSIGRASDNDVVLDDGIVSGHHLRIVPPGTVVDDGSTNGTLVNGEEISGRCALRGGDLVQVGSTVFRYEDGH